MEGRVPGISRIVEVLTPSQLREVHAATTAILERVGVIFEDDEALSVFGSAGTRITNETVRLSPELVEELLKRCPARVTLHARDPSRNVYLGANRVHYTNGYGATFVQDLEMGEIRKARLQDLERFTRLADYLDNVHYVINQVIPQDVPSEIADVYQALALLLNTEKHVGLSVTRSTYLDEVIEIGKLASGQNRKGNFVFSLGTTPFSPLRYTRDGTVRLLKLASEGIVTRITSGAVGGVTAPVTLAGTLALQNAEVIAGICLVQLLNPGNPVIYGTFSGPADMLTGKQLWGAPESAILNAATAQLCRFYRIPFGYGTGGVADSAQGDIQAGIEKTYSLLYGGLACVDVIHDAIGGLFGTAMISSYEQMLLDDEICKMVNRGLNGITVNTETLALDLIAQVGQYGEFVSTDHTARYFRDELFLPRFFDRRSFEENRDEGAQRLKLARQRVQEILATHRPPPFESEVEEKMVRTADRLLQQLRLKGSTFAELSERGKA